MLAGILNSAFNNLVSMSSPKETVVQEQYLQLFNEIKDEVAAMTGSTLPCFHIHDTSSSGYLKSPTAKIDFTFTSNGQVKIAGVVALSPVHFFFFAFAYTNPPLMNESPLLLPLLLIFLLPFLLPSGHMGISSVICRDKGFSPSL